MLCVHGRKNPTYLTAANNTLVLVISKAALVANANKGGRTNVGVADGTFAIAFIAQSTDSNTRLLAAHYKIAER